MKYQTYKRKSTIVICRCDNKFIPLTDTQFKCMKCLPLKGKQKLMAQFKEDNNKRYK